MSTGNWFVEIDNDEANARDFRSSGELLHFLDSLTQKTRGAVAGSVDVGQRRWWERVLGLGTRHAVQRFALEWQGNVASLIFLDDAASEYRVIDVSEEINAPEEVRINIAHGEPTPHPSDECMRTERAWRALREFIETGAHPAWLSYRYVK